MKKNKSKLIKIILLSIYLFILSSYYIVITNKQTSNLKKEKIETMYLASINNQVTLYKLKKEKTTDKEIIILEEVDKKPRGIKVKTKNKKVTYEDKIYQQVLIDNKEYYVEKTSLEKDKTNIVKEKTLYIRTTTSIIESPTNPKILGLAKKGDSLEVLNYDKIDITGNVNLYKIKQGNIIGYVYGKYLVKTKEESIKNYMSEVYDQIHNKIKNTYNGGEAIKLDFYPNQKPVFPNNKMPDSVYALYLNCSSNTIKNIDNYIEFAKDTKINAFVVDIKDNQTPAFPAKIFESLSPTNYNHAINTYEDYKTAITKLKENGFYVIGRITVFKDNYYITDHKEDAILNKETNLPYLHNGSYWPSAYNRNVWYFNVELAKEAIDEFGFNEINFDYVRFPDRMNKVSNIIELNNTYDEDKTEAIQRFIQYATDILHEKEVYVSVDVFGETTNGTYTTAYGQYWPAISNIVDVISGMPYPDHFSSGYYGIKKPWNNPYLLMKYWAGYAMDRQKETPTPAKVRTWIQAYDVMKHVDSNGIAYEAKQIEEQIRGLFDSGATDGYITWLSNSKLEKYITQKNAFQIDYKKEYMNE